MPKEVATDEPIAVKGPRGKTWQVEVLPNQKLVYGTCFALVSLIALIMLETTYIVVLP
ncbi:MAG: hypothetical protein AOA65_0850 [Candidatus Bathyarchaeota archaeon BA1]|nr:MAG: hypothetical protein AOA65_0850 [Candidatus Bathyarchaeota archaeon BA1]